MEDMSSNKVKKTQEQAIASWVGYLYNVRVNAVREAFEKQSVNLEEALKQLNELRLFVSDKDHILGSLATKHGEIAEYCQVAISNARNLIVGLDAEYTFDGVERTGPVDYLRKGEFVQSKFYNGVNGTLNAIKKHSLIYKDVVDNRFCYEIPSDQFDTIDRVMKIYNSGKRSHLSKADMSLVGKVLALQEETGIDYKKDIRASVLQYKDVQVNAVDKTIDKEENDVYELDRKQRNDIFDNNKPTIREGVSITVKSALIEGGVSFVLAYIKKRKEGKELSQFSVDDWKDLGIVFGKRSVTGGIRGATVYLFTNYTATPACIASAYVTAAFGICESLKQC